MTEAEQALDVARQIGYRAGEVQALAQLSRTAHYAGDAPGALRWAQQTQRLLAAADLGWTLRFTGDFVTEVLIEAGDATAARQSASRNLAWARETGDLLRQSGSLVLLADLDLRAGDLSGAARHLREAVQIAVGMGAHHRVIASFDLYGHLCAQRAQWAEAVTIWAAFKGHLEASDIKDSPLSAQRRQGPLDQAVQALGPARTQAAEERGVALTMDTAAEFVLMLADAPASASSRQRPAE